MVMREEDHAAALLRTRESIGRVAVVVWRNEAPGGGGWMPFVLLGVAGDGEAGMSSVGLLASALGLSPQPSGFSESLSAGTRLTFSDGKPVLETPLGAFPADVSEPLETLAESPGDAILLLSHRPVPDGGNIAAYVEAVMAADQCSVGVLPVVWPADASSPSR